ncbi:MAG: beta-ketoacyl synthase N-terminal-like domain-containing protein [Betaproteobacteria bacterium]
MATRAWVTGAGAICAAGRSPAEVFDAVVAGRSAIAPIRSFDTTGYPSHLAGEVTGVELRALLADRKLLKFIRRTDVFGVFAAAQAMDDAKATAWRETLGDDAMKVRFNDRFGCFAGSGGGTFDSQYDFFPLMTVAHDDLHAFGEELDANVNPMWLLRSLPNNVLCHVGIAHNLKGANACITHHSISGTLALVEAMEALRADEADRAVAIGHEAPVEPQNLLYYYRAGLLSPDGLRAYDASRNGSIFGEGAAALVVENDVAVQQRGARVFGELIGSGSASEAEGLLAISDDGEGLARAIRLALDDAGIAAADVGMIVAHANGTRNSDVTEARALLQVFGAAMPPVTGFKWAFGHLLAASGVLETVLALESLRRGVVPGMPTLVMLDDACAGLNVSRDATQPRSQVALVLSRGFGSTNTALLVRV